MLSIFFLPILATFSSKALALFEVATLEHFLRPPITYEAIENPYACNDVPPTESGIISYFLIRKTNVHPRIIAFYNSQDPFSAACTEAKLKSIVAFFPEANTQQVVIPPDARITHWKALSTVSPEWAHYLAYDLQPGQLIRRMISATDWDEADNAVSIQDYDYDWEDIANRRRDPWEGNDMYPESERNMEPSDYSSDWLDSSGEDPNDFEFADESIDNEDDDTAAAESETGGGGDNLYNMLIESTPQRWPMEEPPAPNPGPRNAHSGPDRGAIRLEGGGFRQENPRPNPLQSSEVFDLSYLLRARRRNREIQRTGAYVPLSLSDRARPREVLRSQGFYIDPAEEDVQEARRRAFREMMDAQDNNPSQGSPITEIEEEQILVDFGHPPEQVYSPEADLHVNINPQPLREDNPPFLGYQPGGYTGDVDEFFDFK
ncbi:hypothetical protein TWF730_004539 [Orbilia blumenaviensis]|uniref:Uncharacterized protein n=1 Tax=Orbilia blumenaviensis TaxID=1796055 RepID=A0AAV9TY48_9PEZI